MRRNKLSTVVRATSSALVLGLASQAHAFEVKTGDYSAHVYGFARLSASYDFDENISTTTGSRSADYSKISTGSTPKGATGHFGADAFQSRLGVRTTTPEGVSMKIEGDFRSSGNTLRLRHAYGEYNGFLMGQTWSNFGDLIGTTSGLEFDQPPSAAGYIGRTPQVRYTTGPFSFSAEKPLAAIVDRTNNAKDANKVDGSPALTAKFSSKVGGLTYKAGAIVRQLKVDDGVNDDTAFGFGAFGTGKLVVNDALSIQGAVNYSNGVNQYLWRSGSNYGGYDAYTTADGSLETLKGFGAGLGASVEVGPGTVNVAYTMTQIDWDDAKKDGVVSAPIQNKTNSFAKINYQWSPVKAVRLGVQYSYLKKELENGDDGDASRLVLQSTYNF